MSGLPLASVSVFPARFFFSNWFSFTIKHSRASSQERGIQLRKRLPKGGADLVCNIRRYGLQGNATANVFANMRQSVACDVMIDHDDVIKRKHFPRYLPFVRGIHRWPVNSPHKGRWRGTLMFSLIYAWINGWINNREAGDLRRHRAHYDATVMRWPMMTYGSLQAEFIEIKQNDQIHRYWTPTLYLW